MSVDLSSPADWLQSIYPLGAYALHGLARWGDQLLTIDTVWGYLLQVDPRNDHTQILNPHQTKELIGATGIAVWQDDLWLTCEEGVYRCPAALRSLTTSDDPQLKMQSFFTLPYTANGVAIWESTAYITSQKLGYILICDTATGQEVTRFPLPGVGIENITATEEHLWLSDTVEQTVYCLDRATGQLQFSVLTPYECPTGLAFFPHPHSGQQTLYISYALHEYYVREDPNRYPPYELADRDHTFIHPLYFRFDRDRRFALSNGFLVEMTYVEELQPLEEVDIAHVEWRMALPADTDRQQVLQVEAVGRSFTEELQDGQRIAVFRFDRLRPGERHLFGWKATLQMWSIKYQLSPRWVENLPELPPGFAERYLQDNDNLAMDTDIIRKAAREAVGNETNLLRKVFRIRNYVYDRLAYSIKPHIDTPDVALARGTGSCGEYLGVLLALGRLNGIACRTVGRYKCPRQPGHPLVIQQPDFNHVWLEFYVPGFGWLPMESNPDDVTEGGPYPTRFFMGLAWFHTEMAKGVTFESLTVDGQLMNRDTLAIGDLALNHVRFRILKELAP